MTARRACVPRRACTTRSPCTSPTQQGTDVVELARLLALVNVAMADAGIAIWESKYFYKFWRPVTAIREADVGTGQTGPGDDNPATAGRSVVHAARSPGEQPRRPELHAAVPGLSIRAMPASGARCSRCCAASTARTRLPFTFVSDEFNGTTLDNQGHVRPLRPRSFDSLSEAEEENGQSRIYLGIHWAFDKNEGIEQGRQVANYVFQHAFTPLRDSAWCPR